MICGFCKSDIDNDSFFCDQCGKELLVCPKCGKAGKGKMCTSDGTRMITAKEVKEQEDAKSKSRTDTATKTSQNAETTRTQTGQTLKAVSTPTLQQTSTSGGASTITFINKAINAQFSPVDGNIIGRKGGEFTHIFSSYNQISGKHAKIDYSPAAGWTVTDLDSSNGTKYMGKLLQPNVPQQLKDKSYVIFANIEFYVQVTGSTPTDDEDKTVRM